MSDISGGSADIGRRESVVARAGAGISGPATDTREGGWVYPPGAALRRRIAANEISGLRPAPARIVKRAELDVSSAVRNAQAEIDRVVRIFDTLNDPHISRKPSLDRSSRWVVAQLEEMKAHNLVVQHGREYVDQSALNKPSTRHIRTPSIAPSGDAVRKASAAQRHFCNEQGVVTVLGMGENPRAHEQRYARYDDTDIFVLPEGGPRAVQQFVEALRYLASGKVDRQPAAKRPKRLILANYRFYRPLLIGLFGLPPRGAPVREYYRQALEALIGTAADGSPRASVELADRLDEVATSAETDDVVTGKSDSAFIALDAANETIIVQLLFGSAQVHKKNHWIDAFGNEFDLQSLMETELAFGEPSEPYHAYEANAGGKSPNLDGTGGKAESFARTLQNALADETLREPLLQRLAQLGYKRDHPLRFFTDDRGLECPDWHLIKEYVPEELRDKIFAEVEFRVGGQDTRVQAAPGTETTWWANTAGGMSALLEHLSRAYDEYEKATGARLERRIRTVCVATMVELDVGEDAQSARKATPKVQTFSGSTMYALREPNWEENPEADPEDTYWWFVPQSDIGADNRSVGERILLGERGDYERDLPWMKIKDAMTASGLRLVNRDPTERVRDYRLIVFGDDAAKKTGEGWEDEIRVSAARVLGGTPKLESRETEDTSSSADRYSLFDPHEIERLMKSDALAFMRTPVGGHNVVLERAKLAYAYFSAKVAVHEHPDRRNLLLLVNGQDPGLQLLRRQSAVLYRNGLGENPLHLTHVYRDDEEGLALMRRHWQRHRRVPSTSTSRLDDFDVRAALDKGRDEKRRASARAVAYFCSARSVAIDVAAGARSIGYLLAKNDVDMAYGGGLKGMMGVASDSFHKTVKRIGGDARLVGISTPMVLNFETDSGKLPDYIDIGNIAPDIVVRMRQILASADSVIVDRGGDGTFQEAAIAIALKAAGDPLMRDKPIIFINTPMERGIDRNGNKRPVQLFNPFIEFFGTLGSPNALEEGRQVLASLGVHIIENDIEKELPAALGIDAPTR